VAVTLSDGPTFVDGDNMCMSVVQNITQRPESVLKKKSNSICYHVVLYASLLRDLICSYVPVRKVSK
jgi:hypothetical protein